MQHARLGVAGDEVFFASVISPLTKARYFSWIGLVLVMGLLLTFDFDARGGSRFSIDLLLIALVIGLCLEWFFRRQLRPGQPLVTLSDEDISAPNLSGSSQQLRWSEIETISLETVLGRRRLTFLLKASSGPENKRGFRSGPEQAPPALSLAPFSLTTGAQLLDAINRRHALAQRRTSERARIQMATTGTTGTSRSHRASPETRSDRWDRTTRSPSGSD